MKKAQVELASQPKFNAGTRKILTQKLKEIKHGKNLSPQFGTAKEAIDYLKNL